MPFILWRRGFFSIGVSPSLEEVDSSTGTILLSPSVSILFFLSFFLGGGGGFAVGTATDEYMYVKTNVAVY